MTVARARQFVQYHQRVLASDPITYWPLNEKQGTIAYDWVTARQTGAQNGVHNGVTLAQPGIGDGFLSPSYDGANDYTDIFTATLSAAFDGNEGSVAGWALVSGVGVWTDGADRQCTRLLEDFVNDFIIVRKGAANNTFRFERGAQNVVVAYNNVNWFPWAMTWSVSTGATGEWRAYLDGAQVGATQVNLPIWVGGLVVDWTQIGAANGPLALEFWDGYLAHVAIWDRPLSAAEIADFSVIE